MSGACQITLPKESHFTRIIFSIIAEYRLIKLQGLVIFSVTGKRSY